MGISISTGMIAIVMLNLRRYQVYQWYLLRELQTQLILIKVYWPNFVIPSQECRLLKWPSPTTTNILTLRQIVTAYQLWTISFWTARRASYLTLGSSWDSSCITSCLPPRDSITLRRKKDTINLRPIVTPRIWRWVRIKTSIDCFRTEMKIVDTASSILPIIPTWRSIITLIHAGVRQ